MSPLLPSGQQGAHAPRSPGLAARAALVQSLADLDDIAERQELGAALFLDRPFGAAKGPVEPDATLVLTSLAYSQSIAWQRLRQLGRDLGVEEPEIDRRREGLSLPGVPLAAIGPPVRAGTVSLADAQRSAADFVFRHTLPGSVSALVELFDLSARENVGWLTTGRVLLARSLRGPGLVVYDATWQPRLELVPRLEAGYASRRGVEYPAAGLTVIQS